jgi:hypothetical protein
MARIRRLVQTSFDSRAPKGELQLTGRVKYAGMAVFGPRIMARISTVTRIPCARCLLKPVRARPEVHRDPARCCIAHFRTQRSDVDSDPLKDRPARIGGEAPASQLFDQVDGRLPVSPTSCYIVEHLRRGRIVRPRTIGEIMEMNSRRFPFAS